MINIKFFNRYGHYELYQDSHYLGQWDSYDGMVDFIKCVLLGVLGGSGQTVMGETFQTATVNETAFNNWFN